ncbi:hypothetical protein [Mycoplasma sp. SG1]|uniref:hypothetical protein n=1 Tax=Mycoplasma sp. SG1 TaxID=2810348 RepID=UPI002024ABAB|nr:hypothetical protein [Mycoplasma sp. SG1]URM53202.1 hypothetical protein JRW51_02540 [Mycoplasma sp. SG1]
MIEKEKVLVQKKNPKDDLKPLNNSLDFKFQVPSKVIILDSLGGDFEPIEAINAGLRFAYECTDWNLVIFTDTLNQNKAYSKQSYPSNIQFIVCDEFIAQSDSALSFRDKPNASLVKAINFLSEKKASALVSAANSSVYTLYAYLKLKKDNNISPVFLGLLPSSNKAIPRLFLDLGASPFLKPNKLVYHLDFCIKYCQIIHRIETPKIVILANGTEDNKGIEYINDLMKEITKKYANNFSGKIEGSNMLVTDADIIICEGWTGNISLKSLEGGVLGFLTYLKANLKKESLLTKIGLKLSKNYLKKTVEHFTPSGACLLGLNQICIKAHGSSKEESIYQSLKSSVAFIKTYAEINNAK